MGLIKTGLVLAGGYGLIKSASKAANEHEDKKQRRQSPPPQQHPGYGPPGNMYGNQYGNQMHHPHGPAQPHPYNQQPYYGNQQQYYGQQQPYYGSNMHHPAPQSQSRSINHDKNGDHPPPYYQSNPYEMQGQHAHAGYPQHHYKN
ncbi:hypothetical protein N7492_001119 [Penicillium capsulatum]|uniref:Uncharacterized protein n=1 Tax=Penicillium capsulatum TaxID=69766 RepID=A0A9W9LZE3_9EURO|nr:hypothetical protein N7492_001119 [Penicillium capsulatum]KAJ6129824.1 hypothetical protein N7512_002604 [Penicillium capsulatum]